jgi:hypothetical protein
MILGITIIAGLILWFIMTEIQFRKAVRNLGEEFKRESKIIDRYEQHIKNKKL